MKRPGRSILLFIIVIFWSCQKKKESDTCLSFKEVTIGKVVLFLPECFIVQSSNEVPEAYYVLKGDTVLLNISTGGRGTLAKINQLYADTLLQIIKSDTLNKHYLRQIASYKKPNNGLFIYVVDLRDLTEGAILPMKDYYGERKYRTILNAGIFGPELSEENKKILINAFLNMKLLDESKDSTSIKEK